MFLFTVVIHNRNTNINRQKTLSMLFFAIEQITGAEESFL